MSEYFDEIRKTIQATHKCDAVHIETVHVKQTLAGKTAWDGEVEIFRLGDPSKAKRCYAWGSQEEQTRRWSITTVLEIPPVVTASDAVKAALAVDERKA